MLLPREGQRLNVQLLTGDQDEDHEYDNLHCLVVFIQLPADTQENTLIVPTHACICSVEPTIHNMHRD